MNARTLIVIVTLISTTCFIPAGAPPPDFGTYHGAWAGFRGPHGPGSTGGTLDFSIDSENDLRAAVSAAGRTISGSVTVPNLREGGFTVRPITRGIVTPKGRIRAKFKGGYFRGHTDRGQHDAGGFMLVNVQRYRAVSFWYADLEGGKGE